MIPFDCRWPLVDAVQLACLYEATAPKLGNVHPGASFRDMHFGHFAASAMAIREAFSLSNSSSALAPDVGEIILSATKATRLQVGCNTNLGTLLLFGPIAVAHAGKPCSVRGLQAEIEAVLGSLTDASSRRVYEAIRIAQPGGLGDRAENDVRGSAPVDLVKAMQQVAEFDAVARQYTSGFADIFDRLLPWFNEEQDRALDPLDAICRLQIRWLAHECDGLIIRKTGIEVAQAVQARAGRVWEEVQTRAGKRITEFAEVILLDQFLRSEAHRLNPGTTADLIAGTLLVSLLVG